MTFTVRLQIAISTWSQQTLELICVHLRSTYLMVKVVRCCPIYKLETLIRYCMILSTYICSTDSSWFNCNAYSLSVEYSKVMAIAIGNVKIYIWCEIFLLNFYSEVRYLLVKKNRNSVFKIINLYRNTINNHRVSILWKWLIIIQHGM